jgi:hypothetical protein
VFRCTFYAEFSPFNVFILLDSTIKIPYIIAVFRRLPECLSWGGNEEQCSFYRRRKGVALLRHSRWIFVTQLSVKEKDT